MTTLKSGHRQLEERAQRVLKPKTIAAQNWSRSKLNPIRKIVEGLLDMEKTHLEKYECPISEDAYCFDYWCESMHAARNLLNVDYGPLDCGVVAHVICEAFKRNGVEI
jgi:hypothetical protein